MSNSLVSDCIRTILGDLKLEATAGNVTFTAGLSVLLPTDPTVPLGAATKQYVDAVATGLIVKDSVRVTTTGTLAATRSGSVITANANGAITVDGVLLSVDNRILVKDGLVAGDAEVKEDTDITCVAFASYPASPTVYFDISTHLNTNRFRFWFDTTGADTAPDADGRTLVQVNITGDTTATTVGDSLVTALTGAANISGVNAVGTVTATNDTAGDAEDVVGATAEAAPVSMGFSITAQGVSTGSSNGIYTVTTVGDAGTEYVLTRAIDADEDAEVRAGMFTFTEEGTVNKDIGFALTTDDPITVNFTAQAFSQFSTFGVMSSAVTTDHAIARYDGTNNKTIQDSVGILSDAGVLTGLTVIGSGAGTSPLALEVGTNPLLLGTNATDHSSTLGSVTGVSATLIQSGTGNITLTPAGTSTIDTTKVLDIQGGVIVATANINSATAPAIANSGTFYTVDQVNTGAYEITLPNDAIPGTYFMFMLDTPDSDNVTISNGAAELFGTITDDTGAITANGTTLTFVGGTGIKGDSIIVRAINATTYWVTCVSSVNNAITIT